MPIKEVAYKSALINEVTSFIEGKRVQKVGGEDGDVEFLSVIDFIEKFKLLPYGLYPVQKFIVKLYYNIPLEDKQKVIKVTDKFNEKVLYEFTEVEYLKYLHDQGRCNIAEQDGKHRRELILCIGRRSGKSSLSALFAAYELYKLLRRGNPQAFYGMPGGSEIRILCVANDKEQASIVYGDMQSHVESVDYFKNSIANTTQTFMKFRTEADRKKFGDGGKASLTATFKSSVAKGLRGRGVMCSILDEIAFFIDDGRCIQLDSLVLTDTGFIRIGDMLNQVNPCKLPGWTNGHFNIVKENGVRGNCTQIYYGGYKRILNIRTRSGYTISPTPEHRLKVMSPDGDITWKYVSDIKCGDFIGINRKTNLWSNEYVDLSVFKQTVELKHRYFEYQHDAQKFENWLNSLSEPVSMNRLSVASLLNIPIGRFNKLCLRVTRYGQKSWNKIIDEKSGKLTVKWEVPNSRIKIKDYLVKFNIPEFLNEEYGRLLGILVGDGTWNKRGSIQITGGCEEFRVFVQNEFQRLFGKSTLHRRWNEHTTCEVAPYDITFNSKFIRDLLFELGYDHSKPRDKHTPWSILKSPRSVVSSYLSGLFETDGGLEQGGRTISFSTVSKRLANETQLLLLNFGITSSIYVRHANTDKPKFILRISGSESRVIFAREIGFITDRKNRLLKNGLLKQRDAYNIIPHQNERILRIFSSLPSSPGSRTNGSIRTKFTRVAGGSLNKRLRSNISYVNARKVVELLGPSYNDDLRTLSYICESNYFWDPVISVEESEAEVADLRIPDGEQYVAQGMTNHNSSAERIYSAITPSLAQFSPRDPKDKLKPIGPSEGRMILISSPDAKEGFFYRLYQQAMSNSKGATDMLVIQAPTWEVNPTLDRSYYEKEYHKNPNNFMTEHGAEFSDRVRGWIEDSRDLLECVDPNLRPVTKGTPKEIHFAGIDVGLVNDGTSIAITRINNGKIELVYHETWYAKRRWKEVNPHLSEPTTQYAYTLQDQVRLDMSEIANWFKVLSTRFLIVKAIFDQWSGIVFEQELHKNGLRQFETRNFFTSDSSHMYQTFKMFLYNRQLKLYDYPVPESIDGITSGRHSPLITELLELQSTSAGKNLMSVEAPKAPGKHDDMSDALARSVLLASEYIKDNPGILERRSLVQSADVIPQRMPGYNQYHRMRNQLHGAGFRKNPPRIKPR